MWKNTCRLAVQKQQVVTETISLTKNADLDIRKSTCGLKVTNAWKISPKSMVNVSSLKVFKNNIDGHPGDCKYSTNFQLQPVFQSSLGVRD
ncbi:hypothetical protein ElyMa_002152900 [Elysia marginata]|uniref:Uncharacterized protein n=1 Tax=Elysia marginata TaxID=1093978 RepID=A0AAV4FKW2_9GAST|nr:hypothetical protein ElyMa_002152900 [Elysia marginata]